MTKAYALLSAALLAGGLSLGALAPGVARADDGAMSAAVKAQLVLDIPAPNGITIEVHQGTIHLDGTVLDEAQKQQATQAAWKVPGVKEVVNNLRVAPKGAAG